MYERYKINGVWCYRDLLSKDFHLDSRNGTRVIIPNSDSIRNQIERVLIEIRNRKIGISNSRIRYGN